VPCGTRAFRRSTVAILCGVTVQDGPAIQAALPRPFTQPHRPLKAAPSSGADDDVASWDVVTLPRLQDATPCSINQASLEDALNEQGKFASTRDLRECKQGNFALQQADSFKTADVSPLRIAIAQRPAVIPAQ
jgi:hypothetical protein